MHSQRHVVTISVIMDVVSPKSIGTVCMTLTHISEGDDFDSP